MCCNDQRLRSPKRKGKKINVRLQQISLTNYMRSTGPLYSMSPIFFKKTSQNGAAKWRMDSRDHFYWFCTNINEGLGWSCAPCVLDVWQDGIQMPLHQYWVRRCHCSCQWMISFLRSSHLEDNNNSSVTEFWLGKNFCCWISCENWPGCCGLVVMIKNNICLHQNLC